jgi:hypothetical protein
MVVFLLGLLKHKIVLKKHLKIPMDAINVFFVPDGVIKWL